MEAPPPASIPVEQKPAALVLPSITAERGLELATFEAEQLQCHRGDFYEAFLTLVNVLGTLLEDTTRKAMISAKHLRYPKWADFSIVLSEIGERAAGDADRTPESWEAHLTSQVRSAQGSLRNMQDFSSHAKVVVVWLQNIWETITDEQYTQWKETMVLAVEVQHQAGLQLDEASSDFWIIKAAFDALSPQKRKNEEEEDAVATKRSKMVGGAEDTSVASGGE